MGHAQRSGEMLPGVGSIAFAFNGVSRAFAPNLLAIFASLKRSRLGHEALENPMKKFVRIPTRLNQADKVANCLRSFILE